MLGKQYVVHRLQYIGYITMQKLGHSMNFFTHSIASHNISLPYVAKQKF